MGLTEVAGVAMKRRTRSRAEGRSGLPARTLLLVAGVYFCVLTVVGFWLWQRWGGPFATRAVDDICSLLGAIFAAGCAG